MYSSGMSEEMRPDGLKFSMYRSGERGMGDKVRLGGPTLRKGRQRP